MTGAEFAADRVLEMAGPNGRDGVLRFAFGHHRSRRAGREQGDRFRGEARQFGYLENAARRYGQGTRRAGNRNRQIAEPWRCLAQRNALARRSANISVDSNSFTPDASK